MFGATSGFAIAVQQGTSTIAGLLTTPIAYIGFTLLYYDYQLRASADTPPSAPPSQPIYPPYQ